MKIDRVRLSHFGGLHHLDTGDEALGPLVVVHGPNESGKSTFFHFLTSMLYGFRPATSTHHPYAPWSGDEIEGEATGRLDEGGSWSVTRRLRSGPWGRLVTEGGETELRNRTLPFVEHVPRSVFQKVFALTLHELRALDGETWATLQDQLLARMIQDDLRSAREVVGELRTEANGLWRPDQRGRPRARAITTEILDLQRERREAAERDLQLRRASQALDDARGKLDVARTERREAAGLVERLERLLPARRLLDRIQRFEMELGDANTEGLPPDPSQALERARTEAASCAAAVLALEADLRSAEEGLPEERSSDEFLLSRKESLEPRVHEFEAMRDRRIRIEAMEEEAQAVERRTESLHAELFEGEPSGMVDGPMPLIPLRTLTDEVRRLGSLRGERRAREEALAAQTGAVPGSGEDRIGLICLIGGIGLVAIGALSDSGIATGIGLVLVGIAAVALVLRWDRGRRHVASTTQSDVERLRKTEAACAMRIRAMLADVPVRGDHLADPRPEMVTQLGSFIEMTRDLRNRREEIAERASRLSELEEEVRDLLRTGGIAVPETAPERALVRSLAGAEDRERARAASLGAVGRLRTREPALLARRDDARTSLTDLEERLGTLGHGDPAQGAREAERLLRSAARHREATEELLDMHGSRETVEDELTAFEAETGLPIGDDSLANLRASLAGIRDRELHLSETVTGLERDVLHLERDRTVSVLDGEIDALKNERTDVRRQRDRLTLLSNIIEEADRLFRDRHQPDVVRRSADYLSRITDARYERLVTSEEGGDTHLMLQTSGGRSVDVNGPLSTGTKEQVLLSLRLAVADHLDAGGERMPLFIDEAFVNWDDGRQDRGLDLVRSLSERRQIFVFTCHERLANVLADGEGRLVRLGRLAG